MKIYKLIMLAILGLWLNISPALSQGQDTLYRSFHNATLGLIKNSTQEFQVTAINTNFILPTIRVNYFEEGNRTQARVSAFNNIGVGISVGGGRLITTTDDNYNLTSKKFKNTFSGQIGLLYSIDNTTQSQSSTFAVVAGITLLNFNLSVGREFGTLLDNQKKYFTSISFNIPLSEIGLNSMYLLRSNKKSRPLWD